MVVNKFKAFLAPLLGLVMVFGVVGCATTSQLDTMNKKLAAVEISYQEVLKTALVRRAEGSMSVATQKKLTELFKQVNDTLIFMNTAKSVGDLEGFLANEQKALETIGKVRELLNAANQVEAKSRLVIIPALALTGS